MKNCRSTRGFTPGMDSRAACRGIDARSIRRTGLTFRWSSGRTIDVPSCGIAGASDGGVYQHPGAFEMMQTAACTRMLGVHLVKGAGHCVQQEQPAATNKLLLELLEQTRG